MAEASISINGLPLTEGQAMTVRVAITSFLQDLEEPDALGEDDHGRRMRQAYRERLFEVLHIIAKTA